MTPPSSPLVAFDLDFAEIVAHSGTCTVSVLLFRLASMRPQRVVARLSRVLLESGPALAEGAVVVVETTRHRVRKLPIED